MASYTITTPSAAPRSIELDNRALSNSSKSNLPPIPTRERDSQFASAGHSISARESSGDEESSPTDEPPEGATVFERPNVSEVKGKLLAANFAVFVAGLSDASTGALIPYLQPAYNIGLLFVALMSVRISLVKGRQRGEC